MGLTNWPPRCQLQPNWHRILTRPASSCRIRREQDSNLRDPCGPNGFRDRRIRPLCHLSNESRSGVVLSKRLRILNPKPGIRNPKFYAREMPSKSSTRSKSSSEKYWISIRPWLFLRQKILTLVPSLRANLFSRS